MACRVYSSHRNYWHQHILEVMIKGSALDKTFAGRFTWRFVDKTDKHVSKVVSKMKRITPRLPFLANLKYLFIKCLQGWEF